MTANESPVQRTLTEVKDPNPARTRHQSLFFWCCIAWTPAVLAAIFSYDAYILLLGIAGAASIPIVAHRTKVSKGTLRSATYGLSYFCFALAPATAFFVMVVVVFFSYVVVWIFTQTRDFPISMFVEPDLYVAILWMSASWFIPLSAALIFETNWVFLAPVIGCLLWLIARNTLREPQTHQEEADQA